MQETFCKRKRSRFAGQHAKRENAESMKVMICIGSSCHIKGSRQVVELMQKAVREHHLEEQVELGGTFCLGNCQQGVCVQVDDVKHTGINSETFPSFFETESLAKCR